MDGRMDGSSVVSLICNNTSMTRTVSFTVAGSTSF